MADEGPESIAISTNAVDAHAAHGDLVDGACIIEDTCEGELVCVEARVPSACPCSIAEHAADSAAGDPRLFAFGYDNYEQSVEGPADDLIYTQTYSRSTYPLAENKTETLEIQIGLSGGMCIVTYNFRYEGTLLHSRLAVSNESLTPAEHAACSAEIPVLN